MNGFGLTDELVLTIFNEVQSQYGYEAYVPKRYIHKILFRLKEELPEDHRLLENVPFYWYYHGPISEMIYHSLDSLLKNQIIKVKKNFYVLSKEINRLKQVKDYEDAICNLISKYSVYNSEKLVKDIYYESAPFDFIPTYKKEILDPIERNIARIDSENFDKYVDPEEITNLCYSCESELPFDPIFRGFNEQFSTFSIILDDLYQDFSFEYFHETFSSIKLFWYTFAKALRVVRHDDNDLYERQEIRWTDEYYTKLSESKNTIRNLTELECSKIISSDIGVSDVDRDILLSSVGRYISD